MRLKPATQIVVAAVTAILLLLLFPAVNFLHIFLDRIGRFIINSDDQTQLTVAVLTCQRIYRSDFKLEDLIYDLNWDGVNLLICNTEEDPKEGVSELVAFSPDSPGDPRPFLPQNRPKTLFLAQKP